MAWFPEGSDYDLHWLGPVLTLVLAIALWKLGETFNVRINMDVMEHCEPTGIKEAAKNSWTNIGVVSALVLTMVVAMMQVDHIEPVGFTLTAREMTHLQHTYVALSVVSMVFNLMTMMSCVMNISYIDPLTEVNAMKFFIDCPDTIGNPIVYMYLALIFFQLSLSVWVLGKYGLALGLTTFASMIFGMQFIIWAVEESSIMVPESKHGMGT